MNYRDVGIFSRQNNNNNFKTNSVVLIIILKTNIVGQEITYFQIGKEIKLSFKNFYFPQNICRYALKIIFLTCVEFVLVRDQLEIYFCSEF